MLPGAVTATRGGLPTDSGDSIVTLDQVPRCSDAEYRYSYENEDPVFPNSHFPDSLASVSEGGISGNGMVSRFLVDPEINLKIYLWRGNPWNLEVDAVVNSTNEDSAYFEMNCLLRCDSLVVSITSCKVDENASEMDPRTENTAPSPTASRKRNNEERSNKVKRRRALPVGRDPPQV